MHTYACTERENMKCVCVCVLQCINKASSVLEILLSYREYR